MLSDQAVQYLTKDKWLRALSIHKEHNSPSSYVRGRRKHVRSRMDGWVTLAFESPDQYAAQTVCPGCQILDISEEGIVLRTGRKIAPDNAVAIELHVNGRVFWLLGRVVYHTGLAGSIRTGVKLEFDARDNQDKEVRD